MSAPFVARPRSGAITPSVGERRADAAARPSSAVTVSDGVGAERDGAWMPEHASQPARRTAPELPGRSGGGVEARHPVLAPFAAYLDDPGVTDLFVNGEAGLFVDRGAGIVPAREWRASEARWLGAGI